MIKIIFIIDNPKHLMETRVSYIELLNIGKTDTKRKIFLDCILMH